VKLIFHRWYPKNRWQVQNLHTTDQREKKNNKKNVSVYCKHRHYGSLPDAAIWWCLRPGGGGVLTRDPGVRDLLQLIYETGSLETPGCTIQTTWLKNRVICIRTEVVQFFST
jgi:hypothetical protein